MSGRTVIVWQNPLSKQKPSPEGGAVTEEGKRCASKIGRSARGQVRLPSSVTLPPKLAFNKATCFTDRFYEDNRSHRQRATFSSGEGLYFYPTLHAREPLTISQNNCLFQKYSRAQPQRLSPAFCYALFLRLFSLSRKTAQPASASSSAATACSIGQTPSPLRLMMFSVSVPKAKGMPCASR